MTFDYESLNGYNGLRSPSGEIMSDFTSRYFARTLYHRVLSGITFNNPKTWNVNYFKNVLYTNGYIGIIKTGKYGIIPQICGFGGEMDIFMMPTQMIVNQPLVNFEGTIGKDCELIRLTPDFRGVWDIINYYTYKLASMACSLDVAIVNERTGLIAAAKNKAASETLKQIYEKLSSGEPIIVYDKILKNDDLEESEPLWTLANDVSKSYISDKIINDMSALITSFDREIGIAALGDKKERRIELEVEQTTADACARSETWFNSLSDSFNKVNELFPELNLSFNMKYGGEVNEYNAKTNANWNV